MAYNTINWEDYPSEKTPITAANLKHMDNQIKDNADDIAELKASSVTTKLVGTINSGDSSTVFTHADIKTTSIIDLYGDSENPLTWEKSESEDGKLTLTWAEAPEDDIPFVMYIKNE